MISRSALPLVLAVCSFCACCGDSQQPGTSNTVSYESPPPTPTSSQKITNTSGGSEELTSGGSEELPEFPWPPKASAYREIRRESLLEVGRQTLLKEVASRLEAAFRKGGYNQLGYYSVPNGFALASRLEEFQEDGSPVEERYRWSLQIPPPRFFSVEYLSALINGRIGHYRVIVFVVSTHFSQWLGKTVTAEQAGSLAIQGAGSLPDEVGNQPFTDRHACRGLVYEFERTPNSTTEFKENSTLAAETHLQKILPYLER